MSFEQPEPGLAAEVFLTVTRLARDLQFRPQAGLSSAQLGVLSCLEDGPASPGQLAAACRISAPSMTRQLIGLRARELVIQTRPGQDRRQRSVELTAAGREALNTARSGHWLARNVRALADGDQDKLREALPVLGGLHIIHDAKGPPVVP
jgi:DNA-binding MarR family transcriptional regulator